MRNISTLKGGIFYSVLFLQRESLRPKRVAKGVYSVDISKLSCAEKEMK
jgi:hypothetical protein